MGVRKEVKFIGIFFILIFLVNLASSLGVTPASRSFNFQPGMESKINYEISKATNSDLKIEVYGDFADYISLSDDLLTEGEKSFFVTLKLPENFDAPGSHKNYIKISEQVDPELGRSFIAATVALKSTIYIHVPYPGQYLEIELEGEDVNVGENVEFSLEVVSRGEEDVTTAPVIEIFDKDGSKVETLVFSERTFPSQQTIPLKKSLDTSELNPGTYKAIAVVDFGGLAKDEFDFRIGDLNIDVLNYTQKVPLGGLEKFQLVLESGWNDAIDGAYAEVDFFNGSKVVESFKTTTTDLKPWEQKIIEGYFETEKFEEGFYDANITLHYFGRDKGVTSSKTVKVEFFKAPDLLIWYIVGGVGVLLVVLVLILKNIKKNGKNRKKEKKKRKKK